MDTFENIGKLHWLRASIMGANDGIISTSSLMMGICASSGGDKQSIIIAGISALLAGAMSMATGEYISVSIERDAELEDVQHEHDEIVYNWEGNTEELTELYIDRGLPPEIAHEVAKYMIDLGLSRAENIHDVGIVPTPRAKPLIAAIASAISFALGSLLPLLVVILTSGNKLKTYLFISTLIALAVLGYISAKLCNSSNIFKIIIRVLVWGTISLLVTLLIPALV